MRLLRQKKKEAVLQSELKDQRFKERVRQAGYRQRKRQEREEKKKARTRESRSLQVTKVIWQNTKNGSVTAAKISSEESTGCLRFSISSWAQT